MVSRDSTAVNAFFGSLHVGNYWLSAYYVDVTEQLVPTMLAVQVERTNNPEVDWRLVFAD